MLISTFPLSKSCKRFFLIFTVDDQKVDDDEQWPDFGCEGIKVQRAHQPTSQCQGKKKNHMQITDLQFTLLTVSVTDKICEYSCKIQSQHIIKMVKIIKTQDRH
eukprot:TRINITY_DN23103_c0_g1_i2.p5 TRINITY_DN23103_c0_g1~~TRINITY_DN23103_c0_g1_i2.p5  ORF type:complete len:104 (-),score=10.37 TRINITY_DN23103_c0_g1_i2:330-641(-)